MRIAEVAYPLPVHRTFDYEVPAELSARAVPGARVRAPFGPRKSLMGVVLSARDGDSAFAIKPIEALLDPEPAMTPELLDLARWLSERYCAPVGECLKALMPANLRNARRPVAFEEAPCGPRVLPARPDRFELTPGQAQAVDALSLRLEERKFSANLLFGVPASGKTEVYIRLIRKAVAAGGQALFMVPEISLSRPFFKEFSQSIGVPVALWHSQLGAKARKDAWLGLRGGRIGVAVGPRSAALLPFKDLRLIVVDEEQDESYKQDEQVPFYHARDVALRRAKSFGAAVVLGSATPSIEVFAETKTGQVSVIRMDERVARSTPRPVVRVIDRPPGDGCLSEELLRGALDRLQRGEQVILLVNRRGFSNFVICKKCGWVARCPTCSVAYIHHKAAAGESLFGFVLRCHHCGRSDEVPGHCGKCRQGEFRFAGVGTQRVVAEFSRRLPAARVLRMDRDTVAKESADEDHSIYSDFLAGKADVLVGTKLVAKGFHFPKVTLVGVVDADTMLNMPDFRSAERTVQLLVQAAGRAGRADRPGEVMLQTANPQHYAIQAVARGDYAEYADLELRMRGEFRYPPTSILIRLVFQAKTEKAAAAGAAEAREALASGLPPGDEVLGPAPGVNARLHGRYRYHVLLKVSEPARLAATVAKVRALKIPSTAKLKVNVDPYDFF